MSCPITEGYDHKFTDNGDEAGLFFRVRLAICLMGEKYSDGKPSAKKI
jgi:hypothetical protein